MINNSRESYRFPFDGLLPPEARQEEVFERVALPVLRAALDGYNGTVFAFGQTGSGTTFTITGGAERYADRGLIPRAISALFAEAAKRTGHTYTMHISYMEIYNETGYDLLEPTREVQALEDLPKVRQASGRAGAAVQAQASVLMGADALGGWPRMPSAACSRKPGSKFRPAGCSVGAMRASLA